ncbi:Kinase, CMGC GSK [Spironucleus salmonicida]|uniref:Kinase, CMGC GSK n=1 Tax=Spironucleus salmonicida TaxID=348837 RepID=V6LBQ5_9EUKA|nr:Kinase, CMGC GSK [Spironucleus salmonicida]|eukprot:EST41867.1 Kinase, CMGC GSK [Spironucleus salmonicida]
MSDSESFPQEFDLPLAQQQTIEGFTFTPERIVGRGSFGIVYLIRSPQFSQPLALKLVVQDRRYKNREHQLMSKLDHPYTTILRKGFFVSAGSTDDLILYIIMDYYPETLHSLYRQYSRLKEHVPLMIVRLATYQTARALLYLHAQNIAHRDLKPTNILFDPNTLKAALCDFGSAKQLVFGEPNVSYICSRYYRAPELVLGATNYTTSIDVWSFGCILAEILLGAPLFPGESSVDQFVEIVKLLGSPTSDEFLAMNGSLNSVRFKEVKAYGLNKVLRSKAHCDVVDLLEKVLVYDPERRFTASQVLAHKFFDPVRELGDTLPGGEEVPSDLFKFTDEEKSILTTQQELWAIVGKRSQ